MFKSGVFVCLQTPNCHLHLPVSGVSKTVSCKMLCDARGLLDASPTITIWLSDRLCIDLLTFSSRTCTACLGPRVERWTMEVLVHDVRHISVRRVHALRSSSSANVFAPKTNDRHFIDVSEHTKVI